MGQLAPYGYAKIGLMKPHFLQSEVWKNFQEKLGNKVITNKGTGWSYLIMLEKDRFGTYAYSPYGPYARDEQRLIEAVEDMKVQSLKAGAYVLIVEPFLPITREVASKLFNYSAPHRQPKATLRIDLTKSEEQIIADMNQARRNEHRNHQKKGLKITKSTKQSDINILIKFLKDNSLNKNFFIRDEEFFRTMMQTLVKSGDAHLYVGRINDTPVIAALAYDDADTSYYAFVGRDYNYDKLNANGPVVSRMIIDAKKRGKKTFDLYGITLSNNPKDPLYGFTKFKKTFGGTEIKLAGTWEIPLKPLVFFIKRFAVRIKGILR